MDSSVARQSPLGWATRGSIAQWYAGVVGAGLLLRGALGLTMGDFDLPGEGWHQLFHFASGAVLIGAVRSAFIASVVLILFGAVYVAIAGAGIAGANEILGVFEVGTRDNLLHALFGVTGIAAGIAGLRRVAR
jgi:hypothetical protein